MKTEVYLDMDENRTVWQVMVFDENDNLLDNRPFSDKQDAEEYAELLAAESIHSDKGYSLGTPEALEEFERKREYKL